jgi:uncharacterized iron-regulated protein
MVTHRNVTKTMLLAIAAPLSVLIIGVVGYSTHIWLSHQPVDPATVSSRACASSGQWFDPQTATSVAPTSVLHGAARASAVLLGVSTTRDPDQERWFQFTLSALHASRPDMTLAFAMFPRKQQEVFDAWLNGEIDETGLAQRLEWLYNPFSDKQTLMSVLKYARAHHIPIRAIGPEANAAAEVERHGWGAARLLTNAPHEPAALHISYVRSLAALYALTPRRAGTPPTAPIDERQVAHAVVFPSHVDSLLLDADFNRFLNARRASDWIVAQGVASLLDGPAQSLVVMLMGRSHLEFRWGVPAQLRKLGVQDEMTLLPYAGLTECRLVAPGIADAVFILNPFLPEALSRDPAAD